MDTSNNLDAKQVKFIDTYLKYQDVNTICKEMKISRATYYNYINNHLIKDRINQELTEMLKGTTMYLKSQLNKCSTELIKIIEDAKTPPQVKINAINSVFSNTLKLTEQVDIITKIEDIEQKLSEREGDNGYE